LRLIGMELSLPCRPFELVLSHIAHILGLQLLSTKLPTNMQSTFPCGYFFVPWTQIQQWPVVLTERSPHEPPTVGRSFQQSAVRTGAAVERIGHRNLRSGGFHRDLVLSWRSNCELGTTILVNIIALSTRSKYESFPDITAVILYDPRPPVYCLRLGTIIQWQQRVFDTQFL
jgi:hypothetical protein